MLIKSFPYLLGTWTLRSTSDYSLLKGLTYLIINNDNTVKLRTLNQETFIGTKKSRSGIIYNISNYENNKYLVNIKYSYANKYSYSIMGIEIPEFQSEKKNYTIEKNLNLSLVDKTLFITDNNSSYYYLFDLNIGKIKHPYIETGLNTLIFTQIISFFLNLILAKILHDILNTPNF